MPRQGGTGMGESPSMRGIRGASLEAITRKALADAWARGGTMKEAKRMVVQMIHEKYPEMPENEISELFESMCRGSG